ncbi:M15 family metallopeptidase [Bariatricus massiliensis]|uniref:M15 family metallopeptidase n=1 Tax=Bariatricus massiliensis TaxID=1745713 RepID=A0ABS8DGM5_9FIRM|nr:M15 family metallopeptidase [Bariatricus massiliensis]MCB7304466.1 M15 family metallopeptidase [Bariatricus massiliensis]MCB7375118.1 M15 family metallopeptidase [Bariatricus massiliensis]MCB7387577.1 M15 family metallopeptidase [Bariatricus massiliensis]MCB7411738.1 M15 family metallopeptidase [Bariatricus massiliensis]MCQ5253874.1 M15 family metallopeptidase [Bariatricus massiliensis]
MMRGNTGKQKRNGCLRMLCCGALICAVAAGGTVLGRKIRMNVRENQTQNITQAALKAEPKTKPSQGNVTASFKSGWNMILVNPWNAMNQNFSVELTQLANGHAIDKRAYPDLQNMMDDARAEGLSPMICSSYRTWDKQRTLYDNETKRYMAQGYSKEEAEKEAAKWVAVPGTSEHQTGLAVDIVAQSYQILDKKQEDTPEQRWLMENSYKYGFILRFPTDKSKITGINYEPWHYRYVGKEAAKEIYERGICLEEYLGGED